MPTTLTPSKMGWYTSQSMPSIAFISPFEIQPGLHLQVLAVVRVNKEVSLLVLDDDETTRSSLTHQPDTRHCPYTLAGLATPRASGTTPCSASSRCSRCSSKFKATATSNVKMHARRSCNLTVGRGSRVGDCEEDSGWAGSWNEWKAGGVEVRAMG